MADDRQPRPLHAMLPERAGQLLLECAAHVVDQFTFARLTQAGVPVGGRCLVVGASGGNAVRWLTNAVGPGGDVLTFDQAESSGDTAFDLIYSRLALGHLPKPGGALTTLAGLLAPGGVLVIDEWVWSARILAASQPDAATLYARFQHALVTMLAARGHDITWAERVPAAMLDAGLVGVDVAAHARSWPGGTPATTMDVIVATELRDWLLTAGVSSESLELLRTYLADPTLLVLSNLVVSTIGRRERSDASAAGSERS